MPYDKIDQLYDALKKDGAVSKSRENFRSKMLAPGKEGYQNRLQLYNALKADGAIDSPTYEEFGKRLGLHAVNNTSTPTKPLPQKPTAASAQAATPAPSTAPTTSQQKDKPLTPAQRQAMIDQVQQMQQQTQAMIADNNERMKNMKQYGFGLGFGQTKKGGIKYNPRTKKFEQTYITPTGNRYSSKALADMESTRFRQETSKPLGLNMNDQQVDAAQKPASAAVAALWKEAEANYAADRNKNAEEVYSGNPWLHGGREMHIVDAATNSHKNEVSRLTRFDLQKMMDNVWGRVGRQMTTSCYQQLKKQYPTATEQQLQKSASAMARQLSDNAVYKYAVAKNTPKSTLEFFAKTAADMNLLRTITKGLARSEAGTTGDMAAYEQAMSDYGKNHRWAQIGGTVTGMMFDPTTYISGGVGSFAGKTALNIGGRIVAKKAATNVGARLFGNTLTGRVVAGVAGGAGNLGTYEGIKEGESQWLHGGHINPATGENEGYSAGDVVKSTLHGTLLGSVTGTVSPLLGNVADKWVKATSNTAGKVGIRAGELATSTVAEGTIFSIPEWISGDGDAMDVWTDNMAMMIGFKGQHMIKSAPRVIAGLRPIADPKTMQERNHNRMNFVERLRKQVDASPRDMAFTKEEREELQKYGYGDLAALFTRTPKQQPKAKARPKSTDGKVMYLDIPEADVEDLGRQWLKNHPEFDGYEAMERLMQDPNVSQSARAKAYYILTGRQLPMGTVTGYTTEKDEHGNIFVKSVTANGEVVTNRRFADEVSAKREQDKIMRQAELNSVDVGERYTEAKADNKVWDAAVEAVAPGADPETVKRNYQAAKEGDKDAIANYGQMVDAIDKYMEENRGMADAERPEAIRAAIKEETGVDVDAAIKKEPSKRTEPEQAAVEDYLKRLFPEQNQETEQPMSDDEAGAAAIYDQSRLLWDKVEQGDADAKADVDAIVLRMQEALQECEDAFGTDAEMRMAEMQDNPWALANDPELTEDQQNAVLYYINAKAAMDGVQDASNDAMENKRREVAANVERHTHKDNGMVQPATMKVDDKPVYIVKGNVAVLPDGTGIDTQNSDQSIVICDAETGEYKFTSPDQIFNLGDAIDPQAELDEAYANIQAEHEAVLGGMENGESVPKSDENVQNDGESVQKTLEGVQYGVNDTFTLLDGDGANVHGEVQNISDDGVEIRTDEPLNGKRVQIIPVEEFENMVESINDADGNPVWTREYAEDADATEEASDNSAPQDNDVVAPASPTTEELVQMARGGNELAQHQLEAQGVQWKEANRQPTALERVPLNEETGEPMFEKADKETALDALNEVTGGNEANTTAIVNAQVEQAQKTLDALKKKQPTKKAPSLKGSPMAMVKAQQEADANYNAAMEQYNAQVAEAEETLGAWSRIYALMNERKRAIREQRETEQREHDKQMHDAAVAQVEEQKRIAAQKAAEQAEVGTHAVNPKIKAKWNGAAKVEGNPNALTLADGSTIRGHYVLTEAGAASASHDVNNAFEPTEGFPIDENGESVNDRDYKRDTDAQRIVRDIANNYDSRAIAERKRIAETEAGQRGGNKATEQTEDAVQRSAEPQQPAVAETEPAKQEETPQTEEPNTDTIAEEEEEALRNRITETDEEWTEPSANGDIYKQKLLIDGKEVIKVDAPDESKNYPGTYYEVDGKQFGDLQEVVRHLDGAEQPLSAKIKTASADVNTEPTEAQKEAGNYKKGHVQVGTFDITIEQPQGSVRKGTDANGKQWESKMHNTYGYFRGTEGVDGDHIDVFLSNDIDGWNGRKVYVVDQYNPDGTFDEHKVMLGFNDMDEAKSDYLANYEKGWEDGRRIVVSTTNLEDFEKWIDSSHRKTKPFAEYAGVKKETVASSPAKEDTAAPTTENADNAAYTITPTTYTNKKGKTSDVSLLTFDGALTADQERAVSEFAKERLGEGRFSPARGWKDRKSGGWMFRSEEDAKKAADMVGNADAVADAQPLTAQELRDAVEPKKPATRKKATAKKPANKVEMADVAEKKPTEPIKEEPKQPTKETEKPKYEVSDEEMNGLMNDIRDILGIGADEGDAGLKFRDPDELTAEQRQKLMSVGQRLAMAMVERGNESFGDYASMMVKALGDKVRPWLKAFYGGLEYVPGYDKYALTPYEEVKAFDVENFDKPHNDVLAQADMIVEEGKAQTAADKANNELKAIRNEQRKENDKQTEADTAAVAEKAEATASEAETLAETSSDRHELSAAEERVDDSLEEVNEQLALLGYYEADHVEKDFNEAYGYMRNAEKKAVNDAAKLAGQLVDDLGLDLYEATHSDKTDKKGNRKARPLAVANIAPAGGDVTMHLPLAEGRELYVNIQLEPSFTKGETNRRGDNLEVIGIMCRVENPNASGNARYGQDMWFAEDVTYDDLLKNVQRVTYKYIPERSNAKDGEYKVGDKVQYSPDGNTWHDAVVAQPNELGGIRIDTGHAPAMWVNAHPDQLRHKAKEVVKPQTEDIANNPQSWVGRTFVYDSGDTVLRCTDILGKYASFEDVKMHYNTTNEISKFKEMLKSGMFKVQDEKPTEPKNEDIFQKAERIAKEAKAEREKKAAEEADIMGTDLPEPAKEKAVKALHGSDSMTDNAALAEAKRRVAKKKTSKKKVKPEQQVGNLFAGLFDKPKEENGTENNDSSSPSKAVAGTERTDTVGVDETGTDGGERTTAVAGTDGKRTTDASSESGRETADGAAHGTDEVGGIQPPVGNRGRDEGATVGAVPGKPTDERRRTDRPRTVQTGETDGGGKVLSSGEPADTTGEGSRPAAVKKQRTPVRKFTNNFRYGADGNEADNYTPAQRLEGNVSAIEVLAKLFKEGRKATDEEKQILSRFRGWGQIDQLSKFYSVDQMRRDTYGNSPYRRLADAIDTIDPDGKKGVFMGIKRAALSSYYTPTKIASAMNSFLSLAGFKGGTFLDPSMGNGIFEGTLPKDIQERTMITGVELDWLSGQISRALYPDADVRICGFEKSELTSNSQDVVTSNVPFGDIEVTDPTWKNDNSPVKRSAQKRIHNYYAVKMLELTRPGGLVAMMTSPAVMDTQSNQHIRRYIAEQGEFLGAVRLPDNTFQGTGAMADIIYIRKWKDEEDAQKTRENPDYATREQAFLSSAETTAPNKRNGEKQKVSHNAYYASNRKNMIGDVVAGNQYNDKSFGLHSELTTDQIAKEVEKAVKRIVGDRKGMLFDTTRTSREVKKAVREEYKGDGNWVSTGNLVIQDGKVGVLTATKNEYGEVTRVFEEQPQLSKQKNRIIAMGEVRTAMKELIAGQIDGLSDTKLDMLRAKLKRAYDEFVSKYGKLQDTDNAVVLNDIDGYTLQALEVWKGGKFQGLSDIFTKNTIKPALKLEDAKTPQEAITTSLAEYGEIRGEYIEKALGANWFEQCGDLVFKEPNATDRYVTRDEYLSGDVVAKLEEAKTAAATDPTFERNVKELEQVQPATIPFDDITIHLGARWIPQEVLNDFVKDTLGLHASSSRNYEWVDGERREIIKSGVVYVPETDSFEINIEAKELGGQADDWKTADKSIKEIFQAALEDKDFRIVRKDKDGNTWIDQEATELANSKVADLRERFEQWLPSDDARVQTMERAYNDRFNRIVLRKWDGSHLNVPGLMGKELRPHQKDAVWMLINNRGGIVDHIVGAGKTLVMQSAIMEMRRMGIAKKPMIVALKSTVPQIAREFKEAYPTARVLAPSEKDFSTENRKKFFAKISLNDYDCIIVSHEQYGKIPHSEEAESDVVNEQLAQLDAMIEYLYGTGDKSQLTKRQIKSLEKRRQNLHAKLEKRLDRSTDREFCFENMGIDYLFVDECHKFKSLPYVTSYQNVAGLGEASGSDKAVALLTGIRHLQKMHQGDKGTVFLSGTTITNSLVEIYNLLNYLRPHKLEQLGMPTFDAWASTFAVHTSELEAGVSNEFKMKDRFRYFDNVPELSQLYAEIADVRNDYNLQLPKPKVYGKTVIVPQSDAVAEINREVVNMLQTKDGSYFGIHPKDPKKFPWGLVASGISAKAAVSPRLVFPDMDDSVGKISYCCDNIKKSYDEMKEQKGVQLVFCELGVPSKDKNEYDAYHDIIDRLTKDYGIPREEIAYIQQVKKDTDKEALFQKVRDGKVRILIGGTQNMGTGVNVQTRITDLHMLTVPWQPADLEQCIGRGSRQGNVVAHDFLDNKVRVHYYATEGSLDLYKYQLLDAKGKMFTQFKMGTISGERSFDEGDADESGNIDPAQMVALLSGNPIIFEKSKQDKLVKKLKSLYNGFLRDQQRKKQNYENVSKKVENLERLISLSDSDVRDLQREGFKPDDKGTYPSKVKVCVDGLYYGQDFDKPKEAGQYILEQLKNNKKVVLAGFGQRADVVFVTGDDLLSSHYEVQIGGNNAWSIRYSKRMPQDPTQAGLVFRNLLEQIIHNNEVYHREYDTNKKMLETMPKGDAPFAKQKELDEAIAKQKELDAEYNKLGQTEEDKTKFRLLEDDDPKAIELESLPDSELVPVYRNVQAFEDDALGSPMAFTDAETGERRTLQGQKWNYSNPPQIELTPAQQRQLDELNKNGYIVVDGKKTTELQINDGLKFVKPKTKDAQLQYFLKKNPEDKGLWAAYDPYDHAIETPLNTQFGEAYKRPNLVVVRSLIPKSEIDEPFHADYALLPTGAHQWNNGRTLYLSRWSKIDKVLTREEEAKLIDEYWKKHPGKREALKSHRDYNRFVPQVRRELEKMGYRFELDGKELTPEESLALDRQNMENRDVIPGREGHAPFMTNEDIARINAKMSGKWVGEPKEAMNNAMAVRVNELAERLHTPVRIIRTDEEVAALPSARQRRMKGSFNPMTGEVTIVVPNNANMADVENTFIHEVVGHDGLRVLFPEEEKLNNALDELYRVSKDEIRNSIDRMTQKMYDAEVDRLREKKRKEHEANGEDSNASYYADMAEAHAEASKKREQFKRDATEEYGADLAGRIGEKGFEKMSAEELTFWGKLKYMLQKALQKLLDGLKIPGKKKWGDKEWAFVLHEAYKRKKNGGKPDVFDAADTEVMRRKTGFGETKFSDGHKKSAQLNEAALKHLEPTDVEHAAKVQQKREKAKEALANVAKTYKNTTDSKGFISDLSNSLGLTRGSTGSGYGSFETPNGKVFTIRVSNHNINAANVGDEPVESIVIKTKRSPNRFHAEDGKFANEYVYFKEDIRKAPAGTLSAIAESISDLLDTGEYHDKTGLAKDNHSPETDPDGGMKFRDGDSVEYNKAMARDIYEQRVSRGMYQTQEALQDSMLGLKEAMDAILKAEGKKAYIEDVAGYENAYLGENRLSSVNQAECTAFAQTLFKPMLEEVAKLAETADERAELTDYMMAKHGLERNEVMAHRSAEKQAGEEFRIELRKAERAAAIDPLDQDAADTLDDVKQRKHDREEELYFENRGRDYAGLTALTGTDNVVDAENEAQRMVTDYEGRHATNDLWDKVNAVNYATLLKTYESGLISKATYNDISGMYKNYIPLRGFDDKTSDEAYVYLSDKHSAFNAPIKTAKGRKSKADDPFANMEAMAESAIMQGNRNTLVKQKFLNFALNHPSDLVSVSDLWLWHNDATDEWQPINSGDLQGTERIEEDDSPRDVERKMRDFEDAIRQAAYNDPAHFKKQKDNPEIPYRVVESRDLRQHQVLVKRNGRDIILTINGNPRAAQALNGQTNPDNDTSGAIGAILRVGETINRQLSAFYTTRNPDFVVSNFVRDALYANTMVWVKESPNYAWRFHKNFAKVNPAKMKSLLAKLRNGTLDMNDDTEKMFHQFMMNGGETGYANIRDIEQRKNDIKRELKKNSGQMPVRKAWDLLGERLDEYNRAVENCARFVAFMTSRQMKRSIDRSIYDAKEISVNFNKKGSGAKFMGANGQKKVGNVAAFTSGLGRSFYVFWNAAIQGTTNFGRQAKRHPKKAVAGAATMFLLGALMAGIGGDDGDDENKNDYYNLPEYVRRSNIVFRTPGMKESWISIPLPVEYRAMYGMGELMVSAMSGKEHYTAGELANQIASQVSQMLPIDFMEGGGSFKSFIPSAVKPVAEVMTNEGWTGMPIYKDTPFNKEMPEWTKAYKSANKYLVGLSKALNEATGGDAYTSGKIDINPAQVEYLLNGVFGGVSSTVDKLTKMGETVFGDREYDPRSFLLLNRLVKSGDERTEYRAINNEYFRIKNESERLRTRLNHYENDTADGVFDYADKIAWLNNSPEYRILETYEEYSGDIDDINEELKDQTLRDDERKELEAELNEKKKELVDAVNEIRNGKQQ